jgi:hypothetical protein
VPTIRGSSRRSTLLRRLAANSGRALRRNVRRGLVIAAAYHHDESQSQPRQDVVLLGGQSARCSAAHNRWRGSRRLACPCANRFRQTLRRAQRPPGTIACGRCIADCFGSRSFDFRIRPPCRNGPGLGRRDLAGGRTQSTESCGSANSVLAMLATRHS